MFVESFAFPRSFIGVFVNDTFLFCSIVTPYFVTGYRLALFLDSSWNAMARQGKWRGDWRMEWVDCTLHTYSEHGVSSITTADAHTSAASIRLKWRPSRFKWTRSVRPKDEMWFLRVCHHISTGLYTERNFIPCLQFSLVVFQPTLLTLPALNVWLMNELMMQWYTHVFCVNEWACSISWFSQRR